MRILIMAVAAAIIGLSTAFAADGFVIEAGDAGGKVLDFTSGEVEVTVNPLSSQLLVITLRSTDHNEPILYSLRPGSVWVQPLGLDAKAGAIQIREFSQPPLQEWPEPKSEWAEQAARGQRFVLGNVELVIYAPSYNTFRAEVFEANIDKHDLATQVSLNHLNPPGMHSTGWIEGGLSTTEN